RFPIDRSRQRGGGIGGAPEAHGLELRAGARKGQRLTPGRRELLSRCAETASTNDALSGRWTVRSPRACRVGLEISGYPFLHITREIEDAEGADIRGERTYSRGPLGVGALEIGQARKRPVTPNHQRPLGAARSFFPFLLGREVLAHRVTKCCSVITSDVHDGV